MCPYKIAVVNLMGTMYMEAVENPFNYVDKLLESIDTPNIIVDFHAEATSEKRLWAFICKNDALLCLALIPMFRRLMK